MQIVQTNFTVLPGVDVRGVQVSRWDRSANKKNIRRIDTTSKGVAFEIRNERWDVISLTFPIFPEC